MTQTQLLEQLESQTRDLLETVRRDFLNAPPERLSRRSNLPKSWNAIECFAHLNAYCDVYFNQIEKAIHKAKARRWATGDTVKYSWTGRRHVNAVNPANLAAGKVRRTPKRFNFLEKPLPETTVKAFLINYEMLLRLMRHAAEVDLNRAVVPAATFPHFNFRLGNLFEYMVLHAQRHVLQAQRLVA